MLLFAVPSTQSRLHRLCLYLLKGTAASWLDSLWWTSWLHTPSNEASYSCKTICPLTAVPSVKHPLGCHRQFPHGIMTLPLTSNTQITHLHLCPGLCLHLAATLSSIWLGWSEESLPAFKGLLSFALEAQHSLTGMLADGCPPLKWANWQNRSHHSH